MHGFVKCNTDVAFFKDLGKIGFECCVRDEEGNFIQGYSACLGI